MTQDEAFLQTIVESPDDDTPRLIYADWLDDHGQPKRAEFIRLQIALARLSTDDPQRGTWTARVQELLDEFREDWARLPRAAEPWFERGFVAGVEMPVKSFSHLPEVFAWCPTVRHLRLIGPFRNGKPPIKVIAASPYLARLTSFGISNGFYSLDAREVATLVDSSQLSNLTGLFLHESPMGPQGLAAIANSPQMARLTDLSLSGYGFNFADFIGSAGVRALATSPHLTRLTTLCLTRCGLDDEACRMLASARNLTGLKTLDLRANSIEGEGARALLAAPYLSRLTRLDLRDNRIPDPVRQELQARLGDRVCLP